MFERHGKLAKQILESYVTCITEAVVIDNPGVPAVLMQPYKPTINTQPTSEGWWWHKLGDSDAQPRWVTTLLARDNDQARLYVPSLALYAENCGGCWQRMMQPKFSC